jgi:GGDEF domain-containing protein
LLDAVMVAERVRRLQAEPATGLPHVTVSLGVATAGPGEGAYQLSELVATADRRLYIAKATRDRVVHRCEPAAPLAPARAEPLTV